MNYWASSLSVNPQRNIDEHEEHPAEASTRVTVQRTRRFPNNNITAAERQVAEWIGLLTSLGMDQDDLSSSVVFAQDVRMSSSIGEPLSVGRGESTSIKSSEETMLASAGEVVPSSMVGQELDGR
jgi:hypothetical protein